MLDPKAKQQIDKTFNSIMKVWGRILTVAVFILATAFVCRAFEYGWLIAWVPGMGRASVMDLALGSAIIASARFCARQ